MKRIIILVMSAVLALMSCTRKDNLERPASFYEGNGRAVNVKIGFDPQQMGIQTRALLSDEDERQVYDLYVLAFRLNSENDDNPVIINTKRYFGNDELYPAEPEKEGHYFGEYDHGTSKSSGYVSLDGIVTGTYYIAAVANITRTDFDSQDLIESLDAAKNYKDFLAVQFKFKQNAGLLRNYMTMSGYYAKPGDDDHGIEPEKVVVDGHGILPGYIHLRRADARMHFNIINEIPDEANCTRFRIKSYQIFNMPDNSSVIESPVDHADKFTNSPEIVSGWSLEEKDNDKAADGYDVMKRYELDFYMLEKRGQSKNTISTYNERSLEYKKPTERWDEDREQFYSDHFVNGDGSRDWNHFVNAPDNAPFILLNAEFSYTNTDEDGKSYIRIVDSQYLVHFGFCEGETIAEKSNDFNTRRNTRYNYTIRVRGANDIIVEAQAESLTTPGLNHSVEGTVIDLDDNGKFVDLDAHYGVFNIELTRAEIANMEVQISSPFGNWSSAGNHPDNWQDYLNNPIKYHPYPNYLSEDYQHIRIAYNDAATSQLKANQPVTSLVSYSQTYDFDAPVDTDLTKLHTTLIPVHHEKLQIQDDNHTVALYDLFNLKSAYGTPKTAENPLGYTDQNISEPLVFTVFINEFYYYYPNTLINHDEGYDSEGNIVGEPECDYTLWTQFTNYTAGRTFMFLTTFYDSLDSDSHHVRCKLQVKQRSIETFFGNHILDGYSPQSPDLPSAIGLEQINEHHYKNLSSTKHGAGYGEPGSPGTVVNKDNGWWRTQYWLTNEGTNKWSDHVNQNVVMGSEDGNEYPTFQTISLQKHRNSEYTRQDVRYKTFATDPDNYEVVDIPLNRNRDLNRDGKITVDEVRWFAPSSSQYVTFVVGSGALQTPLFSKNDFIAGQRYWQAWPINDNFRQVYYNGTFHYLGSDWWYVITEEGASTGRSDSMGDAVNQDALNTQRSGEIRCARYLGVKNGDSGYDGIVLPEPASFNPVNNVITTINYASRMRRNPTSSPLRSHNNLSIGKNGTNSIADYFQMASTNASVGRQNISENDMNAEEVLFSKMNDNWFCKDYEDPKFGGRGTWRIPNQVELALMVNYTNDQQLHLGNTDATVDHPHLLSCTYWYRNEELSPSQYEGETRTEGSVKYGRHYLGARNDGEGRKLAMIHSSRLYNNHNYSVRCVRDTDKDGNFVGASEYLNPVNFVAGEFTCTYNNDGTANYIVSASMSTSASVVEVTMNSDDASFTGSGEIVSTVNNVEVTAPAVTVTWKIRSAEGRLLTYKRTYQLPARYWTISRNGFENRYAYVNIDNGRTAIGDADNRNVDQIEAVYKWVLTSSPSGTPVNEDELKLGVTYYLYNAGSETYVSGYQGTSGNYLTTGANAIPVKLSTDSRFPGYYVIRLNNATNANSNGGVQNFGTWNDVDQGSTYMLKPAVLRGEMPFKFRPGTCTTVYDPADGTLATFSIDASFESSVSELVSVQVDGRPVENPSVSGDKIHFDLTDRLIPENGQLTTRWSFLKDGQIIEKSYTYELPVKFYLITSILNSASWGYQYVYVDSEGKTRTNPLTSDMDKSRAPLIYRWILSGDAASSTNNILASELVVNANREMYLYSQSAGAYIVKPSPYPSNGIIDHLPTGATPLRFCFDRTKNGGLEPYFKWDGCNTYGSCVNPSRAHDKYKFGMSPAGMDGAYWKFIPVYRDNSPVELPPPVVIQQPVTGISLSHTNATLNVNDTMNLTAAVLPGHATDKTLTWSSSNPDIVVLSDSPATRAAVDAAVTLIAKAPGNATITATAFDGSGVVATCDVTVKQPANSIRLSQTSASLNVNSTLNLTATILPENSSNRTVTWSSSNNEIATVTASGVVTAKAVGSATITATAADGSGLSASCSITVKQPVTRITLNSSIAVLYVGGTLELQAAVKPDNASDKTVTWSSSNNDIATVTASGVVTAKAVGSVTITATAADGGGASATCAVTVNPIKVTDITLNQTTATIVAGKTLNLTATVKPDNASNKAVTWTTSNANYATVSDGVVTAKAAGTATITATAADGSGVKAACSVTVKPALAVTLGTSAVLDGNNVKVTATVTSGATINSVTINDVAATKSGSGTSFTATLPATSITGTTVTAVWNVSYYGETQSFTKTYTMQANYWLISHRDTRTRYVTVDQHSNQTYVGLNDTRNVNAINAINKWIISTSPSGTNPVNVSELKTGVTYYLFNVGTQKWLSGYPSTSGSYFTVGGTALTVTLASVSGGLYTLRVNNAVYFNKKGNNADLVGPWTGTGAGNYYYLTPALLKGDMPLSFTHGDSVTNSGGVVTVTATIGSGAVVNSVKIGDVAATVTNSGTAYTAKFNTASLNNPTLNVVWNVTYKGETRNYTKTYTLPTKYWLISHTKNPTRYATIGTNDQGTTNVGIMGPADSRAVDDIETAYKWIITRSPSGTATPICETEIQTGVTYYLYNVGTKRYITGPTSGSAVSMTTSPAGDETKPMLMKLVNYGTGTYRICWNNNASYGNPYGGGSVGPGRFGAWTKYRSPDSCYKFTAANK
ncbi:MAG: Ig-like domain-containing protein [Bacteroidales bacterium]|nr:Ig-like domain-containing protein [Bacteroidales bacterium]